jgi:hypothetical protein
MKSLLRHRENQATVHLVLEFGPRANMIVLGKFCKRYPLSIGRRTQGTIFFVSSCQPGSSRSTMLRLLLVALF